MRISDWSSDVCSSDLVDRPVEAARGTRVRKKGLGWEGRTAEAPSGVGRSIEKGVPRRIDDARIRGRDPGAIGSIVGAVACFRTQHAAIVGARIIVGFGEIIQIGRASCRERVCQYV